MRLFFAVFPPREIRVRLAKLSARLRPFGKPVEEENLHITLLFLGESALEEVLAKVEHWKPKSRKVLLQGLGFFPSESRPRVVWVGAKGCEEDAKYLAQTFGIRQRFIGHLTLARLRRKPPEGVLQTLRADLQPEEFEVKEVHLVESRLTPKGPLYSSVFTFRR